MIANQQTNYKVDDFLIDYESTKRLLAQMENENYEHRQLALAALEQVIQEYLSPVLRSQKEGIIYSNIINDDKHPHMLYKQVRAEIPITLQAQPSAMGYQQVHNKWLHAWFEDDRAGITLEQAEKVIRAEVGSQADLIALSILDFLKKPVLKPPEQVSTTIKEQLPAEILRLQKLLQNRNVTVGLHGQIKSVVEFFEYTLT